MPRIARTKVDGAGMGAHSAGDVDRYVGQGAAEAADDLAPWVQRDQPAEASDRAPGQFHEQPSVSCPRQRGQLSETFFFAPAGASRLTDFARSGYLNFAVDTRYLWISRWALI